MVDHREARARALEAFQRIKNRSCSIELALEIQMAER